MALFGRAITIYCFASSPLGRGELAALGSRTCDACDIGAIDSSRVALVSSLASTGSCLSQAFGISGAGSGAITIASLPTISTRVKIGESPTLGTSILSSTLRNLLQQKIPSTWDPTIGNLG